LITKHFPFTTVGLNPVRGFTQVPVSNARRAIRGLPSPVKLDSYHMTFTIFVQRKTQPNKKMKETAGFWFMACFG
jgi:hypothetical protein